MSSNRLAVLALAVGSVLLGSSVASVRTIAGDASAPAAPVVLVEHDHGHGGRHGF